MLADEISDRAGVTTADTPRDLAFPAYLTSETEQNPETERSAALWRFCDFPIIIFDSAQGYECCQHAMSNKF